MPRNAWFRNLPGSTKAYLDRRLRTACGITFDDIANAELSFDVIREAYLAAASDLGKPSALSALDLRREQRLMVERAASCSITIDDRRRDVRSGSHLALASEALNRAGTVGKRG